MKQLFFAFLLILCMTSCKNQQRRKYVSVLENEKSLINKWFGKDHFTENDELDKASLNKNNKQGSFESEAGEMVINKTSPSTTPPQPPQSNSTKKPPSSNSAASNATSALTTGETLASDQEKPDISDKLENVETVSQQVEKISLTQKADEEPEQVISKKSDQEHLDSVENKENEI